MEQKNVLFLICDQFRFDCIAALGNPVIRTPNLDRLVRRGVSYTEAYSTCPVCVAARYTIMTGCEPARTGCYSNEPPTGMPDQPQSIAERCGPYLAEVMQKAGYRTFGIGKFHTKPDCYEPLGFETHLHTEELWQTPQIKDKDAYAGMIRREHPEYAHIDQLHGERTNMYYVPQMSPLPAELTVESFVADKAVEQLRVEDERPYFGYVSFVGPHPPCAPPAPFHLLYDPDVMPDAYRGEAETDHMDEQIPFMNYLIWADDMSGFMVRNLRSRYYAEITYIDQCIGRILDAVEARPDADNTLICFFSDHGDHLGDHNAWQKESFFEQACKIPFLLSAPGLLPADVRSDRLVCLSDLFAIATSAAGHCEKRDGVDVLAGERRETVWGVYGRPGTPRFKIMLRQGDYKYIYLANGGREQLFCLRDDPKELRNLAGTEQSLLSCMRRQSAAYCRRPGLMPACAGSGLLAFPYEQRRRIRIHQFEFSKKIEDFAVSSHNYISAP